MRGRHADAPAPRLRRARRDDIAALLDHVGGPAAGRLRALRRVLKTLVADVYVLDAGDAVRGVVAVTYRRSLARGGLTATVDLLRAFPAGDAAAGEDVLRALVGCALERARRRGCVTIDSPLADVDAVRALEDAGLAPVATQRELSLRSAPCEPA
ncbi:MAG TPA: hypothetical protein VFD92_17240 [Candidatus Binatia bacterium]|nr:hypothetical protein [Candidatus Binatia bacterium]